MFKKVFLKIIHITEYVFFSVDDASGRYSTGWFWGNMYWVGSQSLCEHITPKKHVVINSQVRHKLFLLINVSLFFAMYLEKLSRKIHQIQIHIFISLVHPIFRQSSIFGI